MSCKVLFDLNVCLGDLTCEDYTTYENAITHAGSNTEHTVVYPCSNENIAYLDTCAHNKQ